MKIEFKKIVTITLALFFIFTASFSAASADPAVNLNPEAGEAGMKEATPFEEGMMLYYQKRFADSKALFAEALQKDPNDTMSLSFYLSASYRIGGGDLIKTVNDLEEKLLDNPKNLNQKTFVGIAYFSRGLVDKSMMLEARRLLKEVLEKEPDKSMANTGMGMVYYQNRLIPRARGYFIKALKSNPNDLMALERVGEIIMIDAKDPKSALDFFLQIIQVAPRYSDGYFYAGSAHQRIAEQKGISEAEKTKNLQEAVKYFEKCMNCDPMGVLKGYEAPLRIGDIYLREKDWELAAKYYKKALSINPDNPYAKTQLEKAENKGAQWKGKKPGDKLDGIENKDYDAKFIR